MSRIKNHFHDEICHKAAHDEDECECETCGGTGKVLEVRSVAGEAIAAEWVEVDCPDCWA